MNFIGVMDKIHFPKDADRPGWVFKTPVSDRDGSIETGQDNTLHFGCKMPILFDWSSSEFSALRKLCDAAVGKRGGWPG